MGAARWYGVFVRKRQRIIASVIAVIFVGVVVAVVWPREREPVYQGKKLSEWAHIYAAAIQRVVQRVEGGEESEMNREQSKREAVEAKAAVVQMREWVVPRARKMLRYERPWWKKKAKNFIDGHPKAGRWCPKFVSDELRNEPGEDALFYFYALGTNGAPAVPELLQMLSQTNSLRNVQRATWCLACIGGPSVPGLLACLRDIHSPRCVRAHEVFHLMKHWTELGNAAIAAVPLLVEQVGNPELEVQRMAIWSLGDIGLEERLAVPAIASVLRSTNADLRISALSSLSEFGERARPALPQLVNLLRDDDEHVRLVTTNALLKIAPEGLGTNAVHFE